MKKYLVIFATLLFAITEKAFCNSGDLPLGPAPIKTTETSSEFEKGLHNGSIKMNVPVSEYDAYGVTVCNAALGVTTVTQDWINRKYRESTTCYLQDVFDTSVQTTVARNGHIVATNLKTVDPAVVLCFYLTNADQKELGFNSSLVGYYVGVMKQFCRNWLPQPRFYKGNIQTVTQFKDSIVYQPAPYTVQKIETVYVDRPYYEEYWPQTSYYSGYYPTSYPPCYSCNTYWGWNNYCCPQQTYCCGHTPAPVVQTPPVVNEGDVINNIDNSVHIDIWEYQDNDVVVIDHHHDSVTTPPVVVVVTPDSKPEIPVYPVDPDPSVVVNVNNAPSGDTTTVVINPAPSDGNSGDTATNNAPSGGMLMNPNPTVKKLDAEKLNNVVSKIGVSQKVTNNKAPIKEWSIYSTADGFTEAKNTDRQSNQTTTAKPVTNAPQASGTTPAPKPNNFWVDANGVKHAGSWEQYKQELARTNNSSSSATGTGTSSTSTYTARTNVPNQQNYYDKSTKYNPNYNDPNRKYNRDATAYNGGGTNTYVPQKQTVYPDARVEQRQQPQMQSKPQYEVRMQAPPQQREVPMQQQNRVQQQPPQQRAEPARFNSGNYGGKVNFQMQNGSKRGG